MTSILAMKSSKRKLEIHEKKNYFSEMYSGYDNCTISFITA